MGRDGAGSAPRAGPAAGGGGDAAAPCYHGNVAPQELVESRQSGAGRLRRVEALAPAARRGTTAGGCRLLAAEMQALQADWRQWEESARRSQGGLRDTLSQMALSEREFAAQAGRLEEAVRRLGGQLAAWAQGMAPADGRSTDAEVVESWRKEKVRACLFS